ncbi:hypothetical protein ACFX12_002992 [Malus domestica]
MDGSYVPHIFFNEKQFGGLVALNSLRNSGGSKCPYDAPPLLVYGFDDLDEEELPDQMISIVKVLRLKLLIQDRLMKMKIVKNFFVGSEMVETKCKHLQEDLEVSGSQTKLPRGTQETIKGATRDQLATKGCELPKAILLICNN